MRKKNGDFYVGIVWGLCKLPFVHFRGVKETQICVGNAWGHSHDYMRGDIITHNFFRWRFAWGRFGGSVREDCLSPRLNTFESALISQILKHKNNHVNTWLERTLKMWGSA